MINKYGLVIDYLELEEEFHEQGLSPMVHVCVVNARTSSHLNIKFSLRFKGKTYDVFEKMLTYVLLHHPTDRASYIYLVGKRVANQFARILFFNAKD